MIAVVTELEGRNVAHKIKVEQTGELALISVGRKVGRFRLKTVLAPYGGDIVFAPSVSTRGIAPLDTTEIKNRLLFDLFCKYCNAMSGLNSVVGAVIEDFDFLEGLIPIINKAESTIIMCDYYLEDFCTRCLRDTGTCPTIVQSKSYLYDCDVVFSPQGLSGYSGVLFGKGGTNEVFKNISLPEYCQKALELGVDGIDLAAALAKYGH